MQKSQIIHVVVELMVLVAVSVHANTRMKHMENAMGNVFQRIQRIEAMLMHTHSSDPAPRPRQLVHGASHGASFQDAVKSVQDRTDVVESDSEASDPSDIEEEARKAMQETSRAPSPQPQSAPSAQSTQPAPTASSPVKSGFVVS